MGYVVRGDPVGDLWRYSLCLYSCSEGLHWLLGQLVWFGNAHKQVLHLAYISYHTSAWYLLCCELWWRTWCANHTVPCIAQHFSPSFGNVVLHQVTH